MVRFYCRSPFSNAAHMVGENNSTVAIQIQHQTHVHMSIKYFSMLWLTTREYYESSLGELHI